MGYQLGLLILLVLVCLLSIFNYISITMLEVTSERIESQKRCKESISEIQKTNQESNAKLVKCKKKVKRLEEENEQQSIDGEGQEDLKSEIAELKEKLLKKSRKTKNSEPSADLSRAGIESLTDKYSPVMATDCLSLHHRDIQPLVVVIPEKLPAWAKSYSDSDTLREESDSNRQRSFDSIAKLGSWSKYNPSGTGSAVGEATDKAILILERVVDDLYHSNGNKRLKIVDIPCGDLTWMPTFLSNYGDKVDYLGIDIVPSLIKKHSEKYNDNLHVSFMHRDIVKEGLPRKKFDLIFSRHMLQHLITKDAITILNDLHKHSSQYGTSHLLTTTYPDWQAHIDLDPKSSTRVRKLNLQQPPISLPQPICWGHDFSYSFLALWELPFKNLPSSSKLTLDADGDGEGGDESNNEGSDDSGSEYENSSDS